MAHGGLECLICPLRIALFASVGKATNSLVLVVDNLSGALVFVLFSFLVLAHSPQSFIPDKVSSYTIDLTLLSPPFPPNPTPLFTSLIRTSWAKPHLVPTQMLGFKS